MSAAEKVKANTANQVILEYVHEELESFAV